MDVNNENVSQQPVEASAPIETAAPVEQINVDSTPAPAEEAKRDDLLTKDQMRIISADVKRRTEAKVRAEYEEQLRALREGQQRGDTSPNQSPQEAQSNIAGLSQDQIHQLYNDFKQRQNFEQQEIEQQNAVNNLLAKVQAAGISQKIESSGLGNLPLNHPLIPMLSSLDNVTDVIDDFDSNPVKVANLLAVTMLNPTKGFQELQNLSNSIKRNKEALAKPKAAEPPAQLKPTTYGLGNGTPSVSDKRKSALFKF